MKKTLLAIAAGLLVSTAASAGTMYLNLGTNSYDTARMNPLLADANTTTGTFTEFGYSQLLATSVYDLTDGSVLGSFYDTNIPAELAAAGIPAAGTAMDGTTPLSLVTPNCPLGQCDIDALSPLVPPLASDNEGFLQSWDLQVAYHFDGVLTAGGPSYTGGTFEVFFNDLNNNANDRSVIKGTLTGSTINAANLDLFFDITYAEAGFLWVKDDTNGAFYDASTRTTKLHLDTNVNPPIPTTNQLLQVGTNAIRQTTLDGSITANLPEPGTVALLGLGVLGLGLSRKASKSKA